MTKLFHSLKRPKWPLKKLLINRMSRWRWRWLSSRWSTSSLACSLSPWSLALRLAAFASYASESAAREAKRKDLMRQGSAKCSLSNQAPLRWAWLKQAKLWKRLVYLQTCQSILRVLAQSMPTLLRKDTKPSLIIAWWTPRSRKKKMMSFAL